jgi:anthranilate phosphoribosyltransferase
LRDIVILNAGAALYCAGISASMADGVNLARSVIEDGAARTKMDDFIRVTNQLAQ